MSNERRLLLAILLALGILVVWQMIFPPPQPPPRPAAADGATAAPQDPESPLPGPGQEAVTPGATAAGTAPPGTDGAAPIQPDLGPAVGEDEPRILTLETPQALVMLTNRGGRILSWKLTSYKDAQGLNLELVPEAARTADALPLSLQVADPAFQELANSALFRMERVREGDTPAVELTWADGAGASVRKLLEVGPGFEARLEVEARQDGRPLSAAVTWGPGFGASEGKTSGVAGFWYAGRALVAQDPRPLRLSPGDVAPGEVRRTPAPQAWGGMEDTYFTALFLPEPVGPFAVRGTELPAEAGEPETALSVSLELPAGGATGLYVGPKDYQLLSSKGRNLQEVVHFQSGIPLIGGLVTLLTRGLFHALIYLHTNVVANWGWCIVILTVIIKLIFWPVTQKAMLSMKRMQEKTRKVQPKMAAIKEKYRRQGKKDIESRQKMNQEIMALYQKEGINPAGSLGGCLPLLLQLPILYGFYNLLQVAIELRQAPWMLWIQDLSQMDPYYVLPLVMGGSMLAQQALTGTAIADPMQRRMMYLTPALFIFLFLSMPSGLVLYWLVNNLLGILQQWLINRRYEQEKVAVPARRAAAGRKA